MVAWAAALLVVGDAELCGVLVLTGRVNNKLDSIASVAVASLQVVLGNPNEVAGVGVVLDDGVLRLRVRLGTFQEDEGDGAIGGGLPCD